MRAKPINDAAAQALLDDEYRRKMVAYGREVRALLDPNWKREVIDRE